MARIKNQNLIIVGGKEPVLQEKSVEITENGTTTYTADAGFDGIKSLEVTTNIAGSGGGGSDKEIAFIENTLTGVYNIPEGTTIIGEYGLAYRKGITELNIPSSVTGLGAYALYNMSGLKSLTLPNSITSLGNYSCANLSNLEELIYDANIPITKYTSAGDYRIFYPLTGIFRVGENTAGIPDYFFSGSTTYTPRFDAIIAERNKALTIGQKLLGDGEAKYIKKVWLDCGANTLTLKTRSFGVITGLSKLFLNFNTATGSTPFYRTGYTSGGVTVMFGRDITTIPSNFFGSSYLKNVYVPGNVSIIGGNAFNASISSYQTNLTGITIDREEPPTLSATNAFTNTNNCPIYVPAGSVEAYQGATNWSTHANRITALSYENYADGTNTLTLGNNLWFDLIVDGVAYNGTYTNTSGKLSLSVFAKEDDSTFSGTIADGVATITVNGTTYTLSLEA